MCEVSVVLPTYNRLAQLQRAVGALEQQTFAPQRFEVIVVSDGCTDGTNEWLEALHPPFAWRPLLQENQGVARARNRGVAQAHGRIILFIDDDVVAVPELMAEHLRLHQEYDRAVVLGPLLPPPDREFPRPPWVRWEEVMLEKQYQAMLSARWEPTARQFYTGNTSLPRQEVLDAGGFDPTFQRAEDVELGYRLARRGATFLFNPRARSLHYAQRSFASWCRTPYLYGRYDVVMTRDKGQSWLLPAVTHEFHERNLFIRALARLCVGHPQRKELAVRELARLGLLADRLQGNRLRRLQLTRYLYSGIFNLLYYQGICDELGDTALFWETIRQAADPNISGYMSLTSDRS